MSHRRSGSAHISALILRAGVSIPPPRGEERTSQCFHEGLLSLKECKKSYGKALRGIEAICPGVIGRLPESSTLALVNQEESHDRLEQMVNFWFGLRDEIRLIIRTTPQRVEFMGRVWNEAENSARSALKQAANAYNWLDDLTFDLPLDTEIVSDDDSIKPVILGSVLSEAHDFLHRTGELVGGIFGCTIEHDGQRWQGKCIVSMTHFRGGFSPGMIVKHICNICGDDPGDCDHFLGEAYDAQIARYNGTCNLCLETNCRHEEGVWTSLLARHINSEVQIREVSMVIRPRDPLARTSHENFNDRELIESLGRIPSPGDVVLCHHCMYPCRGFRYMPARDD